MVDNAHLGRGIKRLGEKGTDCTALEQELVETNSRLRCFVRGRVVDARSTKGLKDGGLPSGVRKCYNNAHESFHQHSLIRYTEKIYLEVQKGCMRIDFLEQFLQFSLQILVFENDLGEIRENNRVGQLHFLIFLVHGRRGLT